MTTFEASRGTLEYTPAVAAATADLYERVRAVVPPVHFCYMYFTRDVST
jgi:hypothetical protein